MMAKLNRNIEYALIALKYMKGKQPGQLTTANEISDKYGVPFDATARALRQMSVGGLLRSEQGAHGGYQIIRDLAQVSLFGLIETVSGPVGVAKCLQITKSCEIKETCNIRSPLNYLNAKLADFYKGITIEELLDRTTPMARREA